MTGGELVLAAALDVVAGDPRCLPHPVRGMGVVISWFDDQESLPAKRGHHGGRFLPDRHLYQQKIGGRGKDRATGQLGQCLLNAGSLPFHETKASPSVSHIFQGGDRSSLRQHVHRPGRLLRRDSGNHSRLRRGIAHTQSGQPIKLGKAAQHDGPWGKRL